ncbi:MAG: hypothetical protein QXH80_01695, partial [Candidatus Nanoarchaeia archaeon]
LEEKKVSEQMSLGLEYFLGYAYKLKKMILGAPNKHDTRFEDNPDFTHFARRQIRFWISLTAGIIFLWLVLAKQPIWSSLIFSLIYAVSPAAISRATGQDLIRELFAIPFIAAFFMFFHLWLLKRLRFFIFASMLSLFCALAFWDMSQLCLAIWGTWELLRLSFGSPINSKRRLFYFSVFGTGFLAWLIVPYLRCHAFIFSPPMSVILPSIILLSFIKSDRIKIFKRIAIVFSTLIVILALRYFLSPLFSYGENYEHFLNLIISKIRFMNVKPANPSLLDFDSRILWTPALHSATFRTFRFLFPALPWLIGIILIGILFLPAVQRKEIFVNASLPLFTGLFFLFLFIFMVRFHVLSIIFLTVSGGFLLGPIIRKVKKRSFKILLGVILCLVFAAEADFSLLLLQEGGRSYEGEYLEETIELIRWFREADIKGKTVLAGFTISPMLKAYCGAKIVLQPKFELPQTRNAVENYLKTIYKGTEKDFKDFCAKYNVDFYVFDKGYNGPLHPYSSRYCADAENFERTAPVFRMYHKNERTKLRGFYEIIPPPKFSSLNSKYLLFKVIDNKDFSDSLKYVEMACEALKNHNIMEACANAEKAVYLDPFSYKARIIYAEIFAKPAEIKLERYKELFK